MLINGEEEHKEVWWQEVLVTLKSRCNRSEGRRTLARRVRGCGQKMGGQSSYQRMVIPRNDEARECCLGGAGCWRGVEEKGLWTWKTRTLSGSRTGTLMSPIVKADMWGKGSQELVATVISTAGKVLGSRRQEPWQWQQEDQWEIQPSQGVKESFPDEGTWDETWRRRNSQGKRGRKGTEGRAKVLW